MSYGVTTALETNKPEYIAMSGQSDRFKKKWAREQARKVYREQKGK